MAELQRERGSVLIKKNPMKNPSECRPACSPGHYFVRNHLPENYLDSLDLFVVSVVVQTHLIRRRQLVV